MPCFTWKDFFLLVKILKYVNRSEAAVVPTAHINNLWLFPLTCVCFIYLWIFICIQVNKLGGFWTKRSTCWVCDYFQKQFFGCLFLKHPDTLYLTILLFFTSLRREQTTLLSSDDDNSGHNTKHTVPHNVCLLTETVAVTVFLVGGGCNPYSWLLSGCNNHDIFISTHKQNSL